MKSISLRFLSIVLAVTLIACTFSACSNPFESKEELPVEVKVKTDLRDPTYTFTYGELKGVIPLEKLAPLFENYKEKNDFANISN